VKRRLLLLAGGLAVVTGCRHVAPYERAKLAHPTMGTAEATGVAEDHMYAVHEGATGGGASAESGCGCN
jgi:hypothetical protein